MNIVANNTEKIVKDNMLIVTKTDKTGKITYANEYFMELVDMGPDELIGQPHDLIRHPDMPKIVFKLLWETVGNKQEIHAYVKNLSKSGAYYWVFANVTPSYINGKVVGYHSSRRAASKEALKVIIPLYKTLLDAEKRGGMEASRKILMDLLTEKGVSYDELVLSI